jgi:hypothetical protein
LARRIEMVKRIIAANVAAIFWNMLAMIWGNALAFTNFQMKWILIIFFAGGVLTWLGVFFASKGEKWS